MLHSNQTAKTYSHIVSEYHYNLNPEQKKNILVSAINFLKCSPKSELIHNYGGAGHATVSDEMERIEQHAKNHGIEI